MLKLFRKKKSCISVADLKAQFENPNYSHLSFSLDSVLCGISPKDPWTIADSVEGVQIFGSIGSGKTSGSGWFIAESFLRNGYGGLILTVKNDEKDLWMKYCDKTNREIITVSPESGWRFNFLDYEMNRGGRGAGETENLVSLFMSVFELNGNGRRRGGDPFWDNALNQLVRNTIDVLKLSKGKLSLDDMQKVIKTAPQTVKDTLMVEGKDGEEEETHWMKTSFCADCVFEMWNREDLSEIQQKDRQDVHDYWTLEFPKLSDKTRSIIVTSFSALVEPLLRGQLREMFSTTTNFFPELTHEGALILLDLPVHEYGKVGQYAQAIFKYVWQKSMERRQKSDDLRPVFLWVDEAQYFINSHDVRFQSTARASRAATVYLTQNKSGYADTLGENLTNAVLGNLQTKIFHQNSDDTTNEYASRLVGKNYKDKFSMNLNSPKDARNGEGATAGSTFSEEIESDLLPVEFTKLKKGGIKNNLIVEGIIYQGGRMWQATGKSYLKMGFRQG